MRAQVLWNEGKGNEFLGMPQAYCLFTLNGRTVKTVTCHNCLARAFSLSFSLTLSLSLTHTHKHTHDKQ